MLAFILSHQRRAVFAALREQASLVVDATEALVEFAGTDRASRPALRSRLAEFENYSKAVCTSIMQTTASGGFLNGATAEQFQSSVALFKLIASIRGIAESMQAHNIGMLTEGGYELVDYLRRGAAATLQVATDLEEGSADLTQFWMDTTQLHSECTAVYRTIMADHLNSETDSFEAMREAEVYRSLDRACHRLRELADAAIGLALKHS